MTFATFCVLDCSDLYPARGAPAPPIQVELQNSGAMLMAGGIMQRRDAWAVTPLGRMVLAQSDFHRRAGCGRTRLQDRQQNKE